MTPVHLEPAPEVQVIGDAAVIRGAAARDVQRVLAEGMRQVSARDGIAPPKRLLQALAALQRATENARSERVTDTADTADVRQARTSAGLRQLIDTTEVVDMTGLSNRQAQRLAGALGGRKIRGHWRVERGAICAHIAEKGRKTA